MIDTFTKSEFENALPKKNGAPLWKHAGMQNGEHCYTIEIKTGVLIFVRSTVDATGVSAEAGEDSIRCWLARDAKGTPLGSKDSRWITRVNGWEARTTTTLRKLWILGFQLRVCSCGVVESALKVKKDGPNKGRWFSKCTNANCAESQKFNPRWLETEPRKSVAA